MNPASLCQPTLWPAEPTTRLVELQAAGKSYGEMAMALGLSRNAVAGKCKRLGLTAVTVDKAVTAARYAIRDAKIATMPKVPAAPRPKPVRREYSKSELRSMLHEAMANTARMCA